MVQIYVSRDASAIDRPPTISPDSARSASARARQATAQIRIPRRVFEHWDMTESRLDGGARDLDPVSRTLRVGHPTLDGAGDRLTTAFWVDE